nr:MAG TPA: Terminase small subunit [Caudoviricetes sp.]
MALTEKQKRFCDEYLIDLNATQAAIRAGYSKKTANRTGSENLSKPVIKAYINAKMAEKDAELIAAQDEVMKHLTAAMRGEITEEVVVVEGTGEGCSDARIVDKQISARDRLRAAELLGKRYQLFTDKVDVTGAMPVVLVDDVPDEE